MAEVDLRKDPFQTHSSIAKQDQPGGDNLGKAGAAQQTPRGQAFVAPGTDLGPAPPNWFVPFNNRRDQEELAKRHLDEISRAVVDAHRGNRIKEAKWTNDPEVLPLPPALRQSASNPEGVVPFPPHDQQYFIRGIYDPTISSLKPSAIPSHGPDQDNNSTWVRLTDFAGNERACDVFVLDPKASHYGRVLQGALDNGYMVEALQAISLRPKLARSLFYCYDVDLGIFVVKFYKYGVWRRVEVDDFVPVGPPTDDSSAPICCRSEHFPYVLWPSIIEKAYAKMHTARGSQAEWGGWEALSGGGCVEDVMADLTGGVCGRFKTTDVAPDRLFCYMYDFQRDSLFICRVHQRNCELHGVRLNPYYPYVVNRCAEFEGNIYIQVFCGAPGIYDGGLQDTAIPFGLLHSAEYRERTHEGFMWMNPHDFQLYFGDVFECRLVNHGDVGLKGMPPPRLPGLMPTANVVAPEQGALFFFESVHACGAIIDRHNNPEFTIHVPENRVPCEVVACVSQGDGRLTMMTPEREKQVCVLLKVYEQVDMNYYSMHKVCKSSWIPARDCMVAFKVNKGGQYKITCEVPSKSQIRRMVFRCYMSQPNCQVNASTAIKHFLAEPLEPPRAVRWTLCGSIRQDQLDNPDEPEPYKAELDSMRKPEHDLDNGCVTM
eukprot:gnl/TRDRNA2_/TRDRNA2_183647_c0_seq1.p1 gnl/TRDRNA2_/TRDRNA2_183647_c0~~gnl/TRDRNA2_/TRDRNA2_183647_c0_seq1.p1  ORF type:complete len:658 (-),score=108.04 gnl/TRDRNA2_/TRDRNA2_183647_c0_seq1:93-2066(-)